MKKYLGLLLCLTFIMTPAIANTVKENNYSEELNTTNVYDYVTKKIHVNIQDDIPNVDPSKEPQKYIELRQRKIADLQQKQEYYIKYFSLKLQDVNASLQRVKATASSRSAQEQASIVALHEKWINEFLDQRNQTVGTLQAYIDKIQADIQNVQSMVQN